MYIAVREAFMSHTFYVTSSFSHKIFNSYPDSYNYDEEIHKFSKNIEAS